MRTLCSIVWRMHNSKTHLNHIFKLTLQLENESDIESLEQPFLEYIASDILSVVLDASQVGHFFASISTITAELYGFVTLTNSLQSSFY